MSSAIQLEDDEENLLLFQAMASIAQSKFAAAQVLNDDSVEKLSSGKVTRSLLIYYNGRASSSLFYSSESREKWRATQTRL
jgi:hypothetical protein